MEDYMNDDSDGYKTGLARSEHEDREEGVIRSRRSRH